LFTLLAKSMTQMQYGSYIAPLHPTVADALKSIRAQIAAGSKNA
jgi:hypothetical protein